MRPTKTDYSNSPLGDLSLGGGAQTPSRPKPTQRLKTNVIVAPVGSTGRTLWSCQPSFNHRLRYLLRDRSDPLDRTVWTLYSLTAVISEA